MFPAWIFSLASYIPLLMTDAVLLVTSISCGRATSLELTERMSVWEDVCDL